MSQLEPKYEELQSIYDISNEFFELFLGPTMGYTCAYFPHEGMTLDEGQNAKFDLALGKLGLQPGMTLLDIGCGWGHAMQRAIENYDVNVIGLTLSENQRAYAQAKLAELPTERTVEVRLQGWEEFDEKVDRIVSIGAFEHFGHNRYDDFFGMAYNALPAGGIDAAAHHHRDNAGRRPTARRSDHAGLARFAKFIATEIFPGGRLPTVAMVEEHAAAAGFTLTPDAGHRPVLPADTRPVGGRSGGAPGRGDLGAVARGLRPLCEVPQRVWTPVPRGAHQRASVHAAEIGHIRLRCRSKAEMGP